MKNKKLSLHHHTLKLAKMSFGEAIKSVFSKYATFSGRAIRSEFWYFYLFYMLVSGVLDLLSIWIPSVKYIYLLFGLAVFIPYTAVTVRRFHDIGKSGLALLWFIVPYFIIAFLITMLLAVFTSNSNSNNIIVFAVVFGISLIILLVLIILLIVWLARDSQPGENKWGPNPKEQLNSQSQNIV